MNSITKRRVAKVAVLAVALLLPLLLFAQTCPVCGGSVVKVGALKDDTNKPSRNLCVWNRSICGNVLYGADALICTRCWYAHSHLGGDWERSIEDAEGFRHALSLSLRAIPLPSNDTLRSPVVFTQTYGKKRFTESVAFWSADKESTLSSLRAYCAADHLMLTVETNRIAGQVYVKIQ